MSAHVIEQLSAYMDGELGTTERQAVDAHLRHCDECARHLEDLAAVDEMARALPLGAPRGYFESLPARVRFKVAPRPRRSLRLPTWSWAAAAALLLAVLAPRVLERAPAPGAPARSEAPLSAPSVPVSIPPAESATPAPEPARAPVSRDEARVNVARPPSTPAPPAPTTPAPLAVPAAPPPTAPLQTRATGALSPPPPALAKAQEQARPPQGTPATAAVGEAKAAPSAAFAAAPDAASLEGAAGQHLRTNEEEKDVAEAAPPAEEARKKESPRTASGVGLRDQDALRRSWRPEALRYRALLSEKPESVEDARRLGAQWRAFLELSPLPRQADEARVRIVEMGILAWRLSNDPADRAQARRDAEAYLRREDAAQGARVRSLLAALGN